MSMIDGLDPAYAELPRGEALLKDAAQTLDFAETEHAPVARWALFSGGHDSLTACTVAFEWAALRGLPMKAAHIRTGTGVKATTDFVERTCERMGWELEVFDPPVPYREIVLEYGFPGPGQHGLMYQRLKERCLREIIRKSKTEFKDRVMLITGVRSDESVRRMRHVDRIQRDGATVWAAAIWNWSKIDCANFVFRERDMERNEVVDKVHMSGECRCGAFARPGELQEWMDWFPEETKWIVELQDEVAAAGLRAWRWGQRPPRIHREQMAMALGEDWDVAQPGILCVGCGSDDHISDDEVEAP